MKFLRVALIAFSVLLTSACGSVSQSVTQNEESSGILVKGNFEGKQYSINSGPKVLFPTSSDEVILLQVPVGMVNLKVFSDNKMIVNRKLFLSNKDRREVIIP